MIKQLIILIVPLLISHGVHASEPLNIFSCEPEWAWLSKTLGGDRVTTFSATTAAQDPHHIQARPSLIAKLRRADLLICTGAELEVGWLPLLQRRARNPKVLQGKPGYFEAAAQVKRLDIPQQIDRSMGDVHASGNPHVHLDPRRILKIAQALSQRLIQLQPHEQAHFREHYSAFEQRWQRAMQEWQLKAESLKDLKVVSHHRDWIYLLDWLGIDLVATLEPKPGLPTTAAHLSTIKQQLENLPAALIIHTPYQNPKPARRLGQTLNIKVLELPYTVDGTHYKSLYDVFSEIIQHLQEHNSNA